jgi:plastocyanin
VRPSKRGAPALLLLALVAVGCNTPSAAASFVPTAAVDLPPSYRFAPPNISVAAGTTVTWTNHDNFTHSVEFLDGGLPTDPRVMQPGATTTFTFSGAGLFHYQCSFHPQDMQGAVLVTSP